MTRTKDPERIALTRRIGRLAPLPVEARAVQVHELANMFAASFWLRFEAPPEALGAFLAASPGLAGVSPQRLCTPEETAAAATRPGRAPPSLPEVAALSVRTGDTCEWSLIQVRSHLPWFDVGQVRTGRLYAIPQDSDANGGTLVVGEEHHVVYVKVSHS